LPRWISQFSGLGARIIWSVTVTKFGTARSVFVGGGVGRWACPVNARPHSSAVIWRNSLIGHLIAFSLGFQNWVLLKSDNYPSRAEPGIRTRGRLYVKTDFMVQSMRLRLEDSKDRESTHLIQDFYFAFLATSQYTFNRIKKHPNLE
jgi:hypothetical protein